MSGSDYLIDTNVLIHLGNGNEAITEFLQNKIVYISFISEMELLSKPGLSSEHAKMLQLMIDQCIVIDFNTDIKNEAIKLRRNHRIKLPDAIIAATAIYLRLPLLTGDKDFKKVSGLELLYF